MTDQQERRYPHDITPALADVLGLPHSMLQPIWTELREAGIEIGQQFDSERAAALHFLIPIALDHGDEWRLRATDRLCELRKLHDQACGQS